MCRCRGFRPGKEKSQLVFTDVSTQEELVQKSHTQLEKIHPSIIASYVEVVLQQPTGFKSELREIIPTIITEEEES
jgi:hypothetical protein